VAETRNQSWRDGPQIRPRPGEAIPLAQEDPGTGVIQSETPFRCRRHFNRRSGIVRREMRHQRDSNRLLAGTVLDHKHNDTSPLFEPFFAALIWQSKVNIFNAVV
jgi:hypothetical protein